VVEVRPCPADGTAVPAIAKLLIANRVVSTKVNFFKILIEISHF
jgi:hypothetical protein